MILTFLRSIGRTRMTTTRRRNGSPTLLPGRQGNHVEVAALLRIATVQMSMRPVGFDLGRPGLISGLLSDFNTSINGWTVPSRVDVLQPTDVEKYVEETLLSSIRCLPAVVISPDVWSDRTIIPADELFAELRGFAHVAMLSSKWAAFKLTDLIGKELSCFGGAIRIYWPGLTLTDNPFHHRLYLPGNIHYRRDEGVPLGKHLFRTLAGISAFRFVEGQAIRAARKALADAERTKALKLADEVKQGKATKAELEKQILDALVRVEDLTKERDQLKSDLEMQKASWAEYASYMQADQEPEVPNAVHAAADAPKSVAEVVAKVKNDFPKLFVFLKQADALAMDSPFADTEAVEGLFQVLAELVGKWQKGERIGSTWKDSLAQKGFGYKPDISATCKQKKYIGDYQGMYEGAKRTFGEHVTFGNGQDPQRCLSVHWWRDEKRKVLVISRCGKHGTNTLT